MILTVPRRRTIIALLTLFIAAFSPAWPVIAFSYGSTDSSDGDPGLRKGDVAAIGKRFDNTIGAYHKAGNTVKWNK